MQTYKQPFAPVCTFVGNLFDHSTNPISQHFRSIVAMESLYSSTLVRRTVFPVRADSRAASSTCITTILVSSAV